MNSSFDHARGLLAMELLIPDGVPDNVVCTMPESSETLTVYEHGFEAADVRGIELLKIIALED